MSREVTGKPSKKQMLINNMKLLMICLLKKHILHKIITKIYVRNIV
jgi:hypothetical protein